MLQFLPRRRMIDGLIQVIPDKPPVHRTGRQSLNDLEKHRPNDFSLASDVYRARDSKANTSHRSEPECLSKIPFPSSSSLLPLTRTTCKSHPFTSLPFTSLPCSPCFLSLSLSLSRVCKKSKVTEGRKERQVTDQAMKKISDLYLIIILSDNN